MLYDVMRSRVLIPLCFAVFYFRSYDIMWQDAMADLNEQLHVEGIDQENEAPGTKSVSIPRHSAIR